jgi:hypothetical protein
MISLCHATHNRPVKMHECIEAWYDTAKHPDDTEHILAFGTAGWELFEDTILSHAIHCEIGEPSTSVGGWNRAYAASKGEIVIQVSDDMRPFRDWDVAVRECMGDVSKPTVLGCAPNSPAGAQGGLLTLAICTRAYCEQKGYFIYPGYHGVFEDDDFTQSAICDDVLVDSYKELKFHHQWGGHHGDETYKRQNSKHGWFLGQMMYNSRLHECFPAIALDNDPAVNTPQVYGDLMAEDETHANTMRSIKLLANAAQIRNLPFEKDSYRDLFMRGEWEGAMEGALALMEKYNKYNNGDMKLDGLKHILEWGKN